MADWDMKVLEKVKIHTDVVSDCNLLMDQESQQYLTTVSLDGNLLVHTVALDDNPTGGPEESARRGFAGTLSRLPYLGLTQTREAPQSKLTPYRKHTADDPLACLSISRDEYSGLIAFAGGHDDIVLAYGINSACAVASVYSHRDAVTGLDIIPRPPAIYDNFLWRRNATHIMISGSWDATVKVWSVVVAGAETVSIDREPLAELFDADSTIVRLSSTYLPGNGLAIAVGCSDGSIVVWLCHDDGSKYSTAADEFSKHVSQQL